ncbi:MAG: hypothetical protein J6N21_12455, partial [Butyrivibrio sp.]|nr:hypothetical protein [Butyrivibrio sp.]
RTDIAFDKAGRKVIRKYPLTDAAKEHVFGMRDAYMGLVEKYRGGDFEINDCQIDEKEGCAVFSFVNGIPLSTLMDECLDKDDFDGFNAILSEYIRRISYKQDYHVSDYDLIFSNILVNGPIWTIIDYEWTYGKCIPAREQVWRSLYCYRLEDRKREKFDITPVLSRLGIRDEDVQALLDEEFAFQKYVTGNHKSLVEIWKEIGRKVILPKELALETEDIRRDDCIQVYFDEGDGFSEEESIFPEEQYDDKNSVSLDIKVNPHVKTVRIDPAFAPCMVTIESATWNGEGFSDDDVDVTIHPVNGKWVSDDSIIFNSTDPNIEFGLTSDHLNVQDRNHLCVKMIMTLLPEKAANAVVDSLESTETENTHKENILTKISRKIAQKRDEIYYRDEEEE